MTHASGPAFELRLESRRWAAVGIAAGLVACVTYPLIIFVPMPSEKLTVVLGAAFGPALAVACIGLGRFLRSDQRSVVAELGAVSNALAGALVTGMILVQLAVRYSHAPSTDEALIDFVVTRIWDVVLGLDVAFDMFIGLGTAFFGLAMLKDRRFGKVLGWSGVILGLVLLIGFNLATFPVPPVDAGLFDPGPFTGLWYLVVVIRMAWSLRSTSMTEALTSD